MKDLEPSSAVFLCVCAPADPRTFTVTTTDDGTTNDDGSNSHSARRGGGYAFIPPKPSAASPMKFQPLHRTRVCQFLKVASIESSLTVASMLFQVFAINTHNITFVVTTSTFRSKWQDQFTIPSGILRIWLFLTGQVRTFKISAIAPSRSRGISGSRRALVRVAMAAHLLWHTHAH